jgi:hypothetical protein
MTTVRFVGAYRVHVPESEFAAAMDCHDDADYVARELGSLALVELEVIGMPADGDITEFKQPHTKYVPYDVCYFEKEALTPIPHELYKLPAQDSFRVAFYLHFYDAGQPLITPFGNIRLGQFEATPPHLMEKTYVFWD